MAKKIPQLSAFDEVYGGKVEEISLDDVVVDENLQVRVGLDAATVERYKNILENDGELDPITVFDLGFMGDYVLVAGFHRVAAARGIGLETIRAEIRTGTLEDAVAFAEDDNLKNGLPLSNEDKKNMLARRIERGHEWATWSDGKIAGVLGVDRSTISRWRASLTGANAPVERIGSDGRVMNVSGIREANEVRLKFAVGDWVQVGQEVGQITHADQKYGYTLRVLDGTEFSWSVRDFEDMSPIRRKMPTEALTPDPSPASGRGEIKEGDFVWVDTNTGREGIKIKKLDDHHMTGESFHGMVHLHPARFWDGNPKKISDDEAAQFRLDRKIAHGVRQGYISEYERDNLRIEEVSSDLRDTRLRVWNRHGVEEIRGGAIERPADKIARLKEAERLAAAKVETDSMSEEMRLVYALRADVERKVIAVKSAAYDLKVIRSVRSLRELKGSERQGTLTLLQNVLVELSESYKHISELMDQIEGKED